jgi:HEPN domain-containing protein
MIKIKEVINYWRKTAEHDFITMLSLYKSKRYSDCLFYGHIVLEKILKAHVVKETNAHTPHTHNLVDLAKKIKDETNFNESMIIFLREVNKYNIRCRYPDEKLEHYKKCTPNFTKRRLKKIIKLYNSLCQKLEPNK